MPIVHTLNPHEKDLGGGFLVRRLLPAARQRSVGPFIFFDHFGPVTEHPGTAHDVRPHPHIGLATVTYLFEGAMMYRDSLRTQQLIEPGAINWMTAGRGIVHSERKPAHLAEATYVNHGLQLWVALPREHEEAEPAFMHVPAKDLPEGQVGDAVVRVLVGEAFGLRSPVVTLSPTLYLDLRLAREGRVALPVLAPEAAVYAVDADLRVDGELLPRGTLGVLAPGPVALHAPEGARLVVIGGAPLDAPRHMAWNFVSSRRERLDEAAADWAAGRMPGVPGEPDVIPLPAVGFSRPAGGSGPVR